MSLPYSKRIMAFSFLVIMIFSVCINYFVKLGSYRNLTIDAIMISSILLVILGIYFGVLSNLEEQSPFFKKAKEYGQNKNIMKGLIKYIGLNVYMNIFFTFITIVYDVAPHLNNNIIKFIANTIWLFLFMVVLLGTITVINFIMKIYLFDNNNKTKIES